ncbi:hypothetical protein [Flavobacterium hercynium]|uniref:Uncharacterized protein n=1 Tax=Flavobacterium hercynium TaxID=387094 RepID=A0A226HGP5_9FLAO|nr:hypothetical protein [Flavobacterium hercynium]OXA93499.1 hypothetical protein B0A66_06625 [Flavobacterium hercynium]SMP32041.1 hypothetical protein SAMN06265346_114111 [Flavobacterium hercynium]
MKSKLRKIVIDNLMYLYIVSDKYNSESQTNTLTVKVFLEGYKPTPLTIDFITLDHYFMGQILKSGVKLINRMRNIEDTVNLNEPKYIRELILQGQKNGWKGTNKFANQNGLEYLTQLGYETDILQPVKINLVH